MSQLDRIHPKLVPYVEALKSHEFGLEGAVAKVENIECGSIVTKRERRWGDRFHIRILYCRRLLTWQVLMCPNNLMEPPDFIMEDDFLADANYNLIQSHVPSLADWQPSDPKCLLNVVLELLELYKQFQGDFLTMNRESRFCIEYDLLMNFSNKPFSDFEIYVHNALRRVQFLVHLKVDFSKLPVSLPKQKYLVLLMVELGENMKNVVSLMKCEKLEEFFENINLPELTSNTMLVEYIQNVEDYLQEMTDEAVEKVNKRKMLYFYLVQAFEPALLNGDNITFRNVSFLLEMNKQYYVLNIDIPSTFPNDPPELNISSMRKSKNEPRLFFTLKGFNYGPRWGIDKIFKSIYDFIKSSAIQQYNKLCVHPEGRSKK